ncbi:VOC family protein [Pseudoxanthomonas japonensis]|uniref:Glyoxalase/bleomycin resistance/extradiol dioxygenase family protein n=1 Tax=Pseudoxanthomonas japonensis TaxID=69284 RepID=A0ABQ6ZFL9_9GAMM|nr:VOC family protein [Pseudoxanthomonas japonensis]KAF1724361.1 glyoxalase/bleomycin resistance/extradiol dioxygenase family protein [Pseudoxanthomonas japonensis]
MIDHLGIEVADYAASRAFYERVLATLGHGVVMEVTRDITGAYEGCGFGPPGRPHFWVGRGSGTPGRGSHIAFSAQTRAQVDAFHAAALAAGARDNGAPGLRPHYHPDYYGAFAIDPDGHNIEAVCHLPAEAQS